MDVDCHKYGNNRFWPIPIYGLLWLYPHEKIASILNPPELAIGWGRCHHVGIFGGEAKAKIVPFLGRAEISNECYVELRSEPTNHPPFTNGLWPRHHRASWRRSRLSQWKLEDLIPVFFRWWNIFGIQQNNHDSRSLKSATQKNDRTLIFLERSFRWICGYNMSKDKRYQHQIWSEICG